MIKYISYDIVFSELPNETTLAFSIANCPNACEGCHSSFLQGDVGDDLAANIMKIIDRYKSITAILFLGGDYQKQELKEVVDLLRQGTNLKLGLYSGMDGEYVIRNLDFYTNNFDYIKVGKYIKDRGGLDSPQTNQRLYQVINGKLKELKLYKEK